MKILKTANGKIQISLTKSEWAKMGKNAGWALPPEYFDESLYPELKEFSNEDGYAEAIDKLSKTIKKKQKQLVHIKNTVGENSKEYKAIYFSILKLNKKMNKLKALDSSEAPFTFLPGTIKDLAEKEQKAWSPPNSSPHFKKIMED